jgi:antitoxin component HigA of HigAB toxin-antitoxin module
MKMNVRPIKTEADYNWALKEIARYIDVQPKSGTAEGSRFDVLAALIEAYEVSSVRSCGCHPIPNGAGRLGSS